MFCTKKYFSGNEKCFYCWQEGICRKTRNDGRHGWGMAGTPAAWSSRCVQCVVGKCGSVFGQPRVAFLPFFSGAKLGTTTAQDRRFSQPLHPRLFNCRTRSKGPSSGCGVLTRLATRNFRGIDVTKGPKLGKAQTCATNGRARFA